MKMLMLGSGTSMGVPRIGVGRDGEWPDGHDWGRCDPADPRNRRSRPSIIVETAEGAKILIDTSPDLRSQLLTNHIWLVEAVLWTHDHADHAHGIDDLRPMRLARGSPVPCFATQATAQRLRQRFSYVFAGGNGYPPIATLDTLERVRLLCGAKLGHCQMPHGPGETTGYRFDQDGKSIGYATDFSAITPEMLTLFSGCDLLVVDCLRREAHPTHANLALALDLIERCEAGRGVLMHLDNSLDYMQLCSELPPKVEPGYDGLEVTL